jgi:hypothetical protein
MMRVMSRVNGWSRRRKITVGAIGAVILTGTGIAIAAILLRVPFTGSGNIQASPNLDVQAVNVTAQENASCTANTTTGDDVALTFDAFTGGFCELTIGLVKTGGGTIVLQDFTFAGVTADKIRASDCGRVIGAGSTTDVVVRVTANGTLGPFTVQPTDNAGLVAVDQASYVDGNCPKL